MGQLSRGRNQDLLGKKWKLIGTWGGSLIHANPIQYWFRPFCADSLVQKSNKDLQMGRWSLLGFFKPTIQCSFRFVLSRNTGEIIFPFVVCTGLYSGTTSAFVNWTSNTHRTNFLTFSLNKAQDEQLDEKCLRREIYSAIFIELVELVDIGPG